MRAKTAISLGKILVIAGLLCLLPVAQPLLNHFTGTSVANAQTAFDAEYATDKPKPLDWYMQQAEQKAASELPNWLSRDTCETLLYESLSQTKTYIPKDWYEERMERVTAADPQVMNAFANAANACYNALKHY